MAFNHSGSESVTGISSPQADAIELARLLSRAYLKILLECSAAGRGGDPAEIHHHLLVLGDILQEKLDLHATLIPRNSDA